MMAYVVITILIFYILLNQLQKLYKAKIKNLRESIFNDVILFYLATLKQITQNLKSSLEILISLTNEKFSLEKLLSLIKRCEDIENYNALIQMFNEKYVGLLDSTFRKSEDLFSIILFLAFLAPSAIIGILMLSPSYFLLALVLLISSVVISFLVTKSFINSIKWGD